MRGFVVIVTLFFLNFSGFLFAQSKAVDPSQRYFRLICLVHLTGSGGPGDPIVPEYVVQGTAAAVAATAADRPKASVATTSTTGTGPAPMSSRPGILGWAMQKSDDGTMAIIHIVAADHHAFDSILADTRPEIRVFEIGKTPPAVIQAAMQQYKANFDLNSFRVYVP